MRGTTKCRICGCLTKMLATRLCDRCWEVQRHAEALGQQIAVLVSLMKGENR